MNRLGKTLALGVCLTGLLLLLVSSAAAWFVEASQAPDTAPERVTATIHSLDAKARTLYLVTGVGHALRGVYLRVPPACEIKVAGARAELRALKPGQIVRIHYQKTTNGNVAESIETVSLEETRSRQ